MSMSPLNPIHRWRLVLLSVLGAALAVALIWFTTIPLGVPGEWTWDRSPGASGNLLVRVTPAVVMLSIYVSLVWAGAGRFANAAGRSERAAWIVGLCLISAAWLYQLVECAPAGFGAGKTTWVLYYPGSSGYFTAAKADTRPTAQFLREYAAEMSRGDVLHIGTHPPGLVLAFRALIAACESSPALRAAVKWTEPDSVRDAFTDLDENTALGGNPLSETDRAALWLAALLVYASLIAAIVPLYAIVAIENSPVSGWFAAAMWPLIPSAAIFAPKSDVLLALCALGLLWSWRLAVLRSSYIHSVLAAIIGWLTLQISLAVLPVGLACVLWCVWRAVVLPVKEGQSRMHAWKALVVPVVVGTSVFVALSAAAWASVGWNVFEVWSWNFQNHGRFYAEYTRTYWAWLLVNPVEVALAAGPPIVIAAVASVIGSDKPLRRLTDPFPGSLVIVWVLLWLSGKNMGEAARLWILIMPWLLILAAPRLGESTKPDSKTAQPGHLVSVSLVATQALYAIAVVAHVVGFHVPSVG